MVEFVSQALKDRDIDDALAIFGEIADASPERATLTAFAGPFMDGGAMWQTLSLLVPIQGAAHRSQRVLRATAAPALPGCPARPHAARRRRRGPLL